MALGLVAAGALLGLVLSGRDGLQPQAASPRLWTAQAPAPRSAYIDRKVGSTYEGIALKRDGTYSRTVVDNWGRSYQQQGTWRGYGGTVQSGKSRMNRRIELDGYSDTRDVISSGDTEDAPKSTKSIYSGDYYTH